MRCDSIVRSIMWFVVSAMYACGGGRPHADGGPSTRPTAAMDASGPPATSATADAGRSKDPTRLGSGAPDAAVRDAGSRDARVADAMAQQDAGHDAGLPPSCDAALAVTQKKFVDSVAAADRYCRQTSDCLQVTTLPSCTPLCVGAAVSQTGKKQIETASSAAEASCSLLTSRGCSTAAMPCAPAAPSALACIDNRCRVTAECPGCPPECFLAPVIGMTNNQPPTYPYFHDPLSGTCVRGFYAGSGGNANRFDTLAQCMQKCPPPKTCPDDRELRSVCLDCNGMCLDRRDVCSWPCKVDDDCDGEIIDAQWCINGICDPGGHVCE